MATPSSASAGSLGELERTTSATSSLISQLQAVISNIAAERKDPRENPGESPESPETETNALSLAHDSASLIKAHSSKISLLIINEPFTPSAIARVLRELTAGPLPAIASAAELCRADRYTRTIRRDLAWRCAKVLKELGELVRRIPADGKALTGHKKSGSTGGAEAGEKGSVPVTAQLWAACDGVVELAKLGVAGYLVHKVGQFRDTLKDVLDELKEWRDENDGDHGVSSVNGLATQLDATHIADTQDMLDELMNTGQHIPAGDPNGIRPRLDASIARLRLTTHFIKALVKRRLATLPPLPPLSPSDVPARLDQIFELLKEMPEHLGNLAMAFYELDSDAIDQAMDDCFLGAFLSSGLVQKTWSGQPDEFSDWVAKFQHELKKG